MPQYPARYQSCVVFVRLLLSLGGARKINTLRVFRVFRIIACFHTAHCHFLVLRPHLLQLGLEAEHVYLPITAVADEGLVRVVVAPAQGTPL